MLFEICLFTVGSDAEEGEFAGGQQGAVAGGDLHRGQAGGASAVDDTAFGIDNAAALITQEMEGTGLGDIAASIGMGRVAGSVVRQRIQCVRGCRRSCLRCRYA